MADISLLKLETKTRLLGHEISRKKKVTSLAGPFKFGRFSKAKLNHDLKSKKKIISLLHK